MAVSEQLRTTIAERADGKCEYCRSPERYAITKFSVEHVQPKSKCGSDGIGNLAFSCQQCNNHKYTAIEHVDPVSTRVFPLFNPRVDLWNDHFAWDFSCTKIVGMSGIGRATIDRLNLNREGLMNLRRLLFDKNLHP
jgi:5-methylcytosine-specific restriction endonuclease McrA